MKIGIVACEIMKMELENLLPSFPEVTGVIYLEPGLHANPDKLRAAILAQMRAIEPCVDVIFLAYGFCRSLEGIESELSVAVVMPQMDDCIQILMTPQQYAVEIRKEVGTWFMSPGWAEVGVEMVIRELHLDRATRYGKDPIALAKRLFTHYRRVLCIDTGVGDPERFRKQARNFCDLFQLTMEKVEGTSCILQEHLDKAREIARQRRHAHSRDSYLKGRPTAVAVTSS